MKDLIFNMLAGVGLAGVVIGAALTITGLVTQNSRAVLSNYGQTLAITQRVCDRDQMDAVIGTDGKSYQVEFYGESMPKGFKAVKTVIHHN